MKNNFKKIFCAILMSFTALTNAYADAFEDTFKDFTSCDASMFMTLRREATAWKSLTTLDNLGNYSRIKVKNRSVPHDNHIDFAEPPTVAGLKLLSFFDETSDLNDLGLYYFWGFVVPGKVDEVAQKLKPLVAHGELIRNDDGTYVRAEIRTPDSRWIPLAGSSAIPTGNRKIERVLLIEPFEEHPDQVRVSCSLQGDINAAALIEGRPDIGQNLYPKRVWLVRFNDVPIPENVDKIVRQFNWPPKFKKLRYTYTYKNRNPKSPPEVPLTMELEAQEGLVLIREISDSPIKIQRLMLAGLAQLKVATTDPVYIRFRLTTDLKLSLPARLEKGAKLSVAHVMRIHPPQPRDTDLLSSMQCEVVEEVGADTVFHTLTGRAFRLWCTTDKKDSILNKIFLEDLGIAVDLGDKAEDGSWTNRYLEFAIER